MVTAAGTTISRLGDDFGVCRPDEVAVAIPTAGEASPSQRCPNRPLYNFAGTLEAVSASDALHEYVEINRGFPGDDVIDHAA